MRFVYEIIWLACRVVNCGTKYQNIIMTLSCVFTVEVVGHDTHPLLQQKHNTHTHTHHSPSIRFDSFSTSIISFYFHFISISTLFYNHNQSIRKELFIFPIHDYIFIKQEKKKNKFKKIYGNDILWLKIIRVFIIFEVAFGGRWSWKGPNIHAGLFPSRSQFGIIKNQ